MKIDFQQGIITYPISNGQQVFLAKIGDYVSLQTANGRTDITFAHGTENYLLTEASDVNNAWGPLLPNTDYWLYWNLDLLTAVRTFGFTTVAPVYGPTQPTAVNGLHWFDTVNHKMFLYQTGGWREVVRLFAAKVNNAIFTGLGEGITGQPFAGSQVRLVNFGLTAGRIIVDETGTPIRRTNNLFFTSEDEFFINGSPVNTIRLEANIVNATAKENIARYQVVKYTSFGHIHLATYNDIQTTMLAMSMEDILLEHTGTLCVQGVITNPEWNWQTVGASLWVNGYGLLSETNPFVVDPITHPEGKVPVARVLTQTSIFFDQGLGGKGDKGDNAVATPFASATVFGITKLSVDPAVTTNPIAVGINDPILTPYTHPATHPATMITTDTYGILTGLNAQTQLHQLADRTLDSLVPTPTLNDYLKWNGTNWVNSAITFPFIPTTLDSLSDVIVPTPTLNDYLKWNGTNWVNSVLTIPPSGVTSVDVVGGTTGLTTSGGPVISSGTITFAGTLNIANGGTGQTTANAAFNALAPSQATNIGKYLTTNGTNTSWGTLSGGGVTISDDTTTNSTFYPTFINAITGSMTIATVSSTKLTYNPFSGTMFATNFHSTSDENLKTDINTINDGLSVVRHLTGVGFKWKDTNIKSFGVIAQQVEKVIPEIVLTSTLDGSKSVEYDAITAFLIEAIKELADRLEILENK